MRIRPKLGSFDRSSLEREARKIFRKIRSKAQEGFLDSLYIILIAVGQLRVALGCRGPRIEHRTYFATGHAR